MPFFFFQSQKNEHVLEHVLVLNNDCHLRILYYNVFILQGLGEDHVPEQMLIVHDEYRV